MWDDSTLIEEPKGDADKGKPMDKINRSSCEKLSQGQKPSPTKLTQNLGSCVKGDRDRDRAALLLHNMKCIVHLVRFRNSITLNITTLGRTL